MPTSRSSGRFAVVAFVLVCSAVAQHRWIPLGALPRFVASPVYDPTRDRVVTFGSYEQTIDENVRALEWNGRWQLHQQTSDSGIADLFGAVFDGSRNEMVLVGKDSPSGLGQPLTSVYRSGRYHTFPGQPLRAKVGLVYDAARGEVIAFGGDGVSFSVLDETWSWDGTSWALRSPAVRPPARQGPAMVFDPTRGEVVMFGGSDGVLSPFGDTWTWNGQTWQQVASSGPAPRERAGFAFDAISGTCLLHGGYAGQTEVAGTWQWDGTSWNQLSAPATPGAGHLVETATRPLLLREQADADNGTYLWNGNAFDLVAGPENPTVGYPSGWTYDGARDELVLFGGSWTVDSGLWLWNGSWRQLGLLSPGPVGRRYNCLAYDALRQEVVVFGGRDADVGGLSLGDTWTWDGTAWTAHPVANGPGPRHSSAMAFHAASGRCVLFGGYQLGTMGDTWLWDGTTWTQAMPATQPSPRQRHSMAYDPMRQRVVMNQGYPSSAVPETWEWDGSDWHAAAPLAAPQGQIVYDGQLGRVIVATLSGAIHSWDGAQWQPVPAYTPLGMRPAPWAMAWHEGLGQVVLYAGSRVEQRLWSLDQTPPIAESYGTPCPGATTNDCDLLALGYPRLGNHALELDLRGAIADTYGLVAFGMGQGTVPIAAGCSLLVDPALGSVIVWLGGGSVSRLRMPIPAVSAFLGLELTAQGFVLDGTGPFGASASRGLRLRLGR